MLYKLLKILDKNINFVTVSAIKTNVNHAEKSDEVKPKR